MTDIVLLDNGNLNVTYFHRYFGLPRLLRRFYGVTFSLPPPRSPATQGSDSEKALMILILLGCSLEAGKPVGAPSGRAG